MIEVALPGVFPSGKRSRNSTLANGLVNDESRLITSVAEIAAKRTEMIAYLFGAGGLGSAVPTIMASITNPIASMSNLSRVDGLALATTATASTGTITVNTPGYRFVPTANVKHRAVLHCGGHLSTMNDDHTASPSNIGYGDWRMISSLVAAGFDVFAYFMPGYWPGNDAVCEANWGGTGDPHDWLCNNVADSAAGNATRLFLSMPIAITNYIVGLGTFTDVSSMGLSGGGWTATMHAALDTRVAKAYSVAGSEPLYMRTGNAVGDSEQKLASVYSRCGYLDWYILAAQKKLALMYNANDTIFGPAQFTPTGAGPRVAGMTWAQAATDFTQEVAGVLRSNGVGSATYSVDNTATMHQITWATAAAIVADLG